MERTALGQPRQCGGPGDWGLVERRLVGCPAPLPENLGSDQRPSHVSMVSAPPYQFYQSERPSYAVQTGPLPLTNNHNRVSNTFVAAQRSTQQRSHGSQAKSRE